MARNETVAERVIRLAGLGHLDRTDQKNLIAQVNQELRAAWRQAAGIARKVADECPADSEAAAAAVTKVWDACVARGKEFRA